MPAKLHRAAIVDGQPVLFPLTDGHALEQPEPPPPAPPAAPFARRGRPPSPVDHDAPPAPDRKLMTEGEVLAAMGLTTAELDILIQQERFPHPCSKWIKRVGQWQWHRRWIRYRAETAIAQWKVAITTPPQTPLPPSSPNP